MPMTAPTAKPALAIGEPATVELPKAVPAKAPPPRLRQPEIDLSKQALTRRLVESLAPMRPDTKQAAETKERPVSEPAVSDAVSALRGDESEMLARPALASELAPKPAQLPQSVRQAPAAKPVPAAAKPKSAPKAEAPAPNFAASYELLSDALAQTQEITRQTTLQIADTRLQAATSLIGLQQKLLEIVHDNLNASFAMAQKIVATPNLSEAMALHRRYAQDQVLALTDQAAELRKISTELVQNAQHPWTDFWRKATRG
jgi:hypothetical protein